MRGKADRLRMADQWAEAGEAEKVKMLLEPLLGTSNQQAPFLFNIVLKAYANAADLIGAETWYRQMLLAKVRLNGRTFGKLCKSAAKAREPLCCERWVFRGDQHGFPVTAAQLTTLVDACHYDPQRADCWLHRKRIFSDTEEADIKSRAAAASVAAWAEAGDLRKAEMAFRQAAQGNGINRQLWTTMLNAYAKSSASEKAAEWFQSGLQMKLKPCTVSYTSVMEAFARGGDSEGPRELRVF